MMNSRDKFLGMDRPISRRDFCQGVAVGLGSLPLLAMSDPLQAAPLPPDYYPPVLTGLRGSHPGSFETAHALARAGKTFPIPSEQTDRTYDLIVVGGGISGLSAAYFYLKHDPAARILILDNHDDFGGHAKRNEFHFKDRMVLGHGGSQSIDTPARYSRIAKELLQELSIDVKRFYKYYDRKFSSRNHLRSCVYFDRDHYGSSRRVRKGKSSWDWTFDNPGEFASAVSMSEIARRDLLRLIVEKRDYLPGLDRDRKIAYLRQTFYNDFLRKDAGVDPEVIQYISRRPETYWGLQTDSLSALECYREGYPGFAGMQLGRVDNIPVFDQPYIFHFPDGNASIARLLVRKLIPGAAAGHSMEDIVTARLHYDQLDREDNAVRIRLNSTAVNVRQGDAGVDITYVADGKTFRARGEQAVLACWHCMIPYLCPQLPDYQRQALAMQVKVPLVYTNVLLSNWHAFSKAGMDGAYCPGSFYTDVMLDFPVSLGDYHYSENPDQPIVVHMAKGYNSPGKGLDPRSQFRAGRGRIFTTDFKTFEYETRNQLYNLLGDAGFNPGEDIAAITVNRWPHGYAYEYVEMWDPPWQPGLAPHEIARRPFGRITIANSDAEAHAYADAAIDAAHRAIEQILAMT